MPRDQPGHRDAPQHQRPRARARRLLLRRRRLGRLRPRRGGDRLGHRRLGARPGRLERPRRAEDRPTALLPLDGVVPLCPRFDTVGPLCRSVEDAALLLAALGGRARPRPRRRRARRARGSSSSTTPRSLPDPRRPRRRPSRPRSTGFAAAGARLEPRALRPALAGCWRSAPCVFAGRGLRRLARRRSRPARRLMFAPIRERFRAGAGFSAAGLCRRLARPRRHARRLARGHRRLRRRARCRPPPTCRRTSSGCSPTPPTSPPRTCSALRNTRIANLLGLCALTLPTGIPSCGADGDGRAGGPRRGSCGSARRWSGRLA